MIDINSPEYQCFLKLVENHQRYAEAVRNRPPSTLDPLPPPRMNRHGNKIQPRPRNRRLTAHGQTMSVKEWAKKTGISVKTIENRINRLKWDIERALTVIPRRNGYYA